MQNTAFRQNMAVGQLYTNEITDRRILQALVNVPREPFVPQVRQAAAYVDEDIDLGNGRYLLAPLTFAQLLELAKITPSCRVLVIGCATGYTAAVIKKLGGHVVAIDSNADFVAKTREHAKRLKLGDIDIEHVSNLSEGYGKSAPYNAIVICGAVRDIPEDLNTQLAMDGRLVAVRNISQRPGLSGGLGKVLLVRRIDRHLQYREYFDAATAILPGF